MPEKQGIFNFEKQEAGRDIYNIAIQHLATGKKANLPSIQYALRKGETTKGNFFKNEPEWVDYEQGYIIERKEVQEIANKLEKDKVQLVLGNPASGKSIILKNLGYLLANQNKKIYIVELKKHQVDEVKLYFESIPEINDDNPIFIVDDAHLYPSDCERLVRDFKSGGNGKLIIGSRPTEEILPNHPKKTSEFQFLNKTEIHAEDVTEEMIRTFLKKQHNFSDERIDTVSKNLQVYKNDLWQLSWALNAYKPEKDSVDKEEIYENIMVSITEIEIKERKRISGVDVFLPLSIFYRYEIQVEWDFLEEQLEIDEDVLNQLIELSEIVETREKGNRMLSLHHSSLAELYFGTYQRYLSFGKKIKKIILNDKDDKDLEYCLFYRYFTTSDPRNAIDIVIILGWDNLKGGKKILKRLIEDEIQKIIEKAVVKEDDIWKIGECVSKIATAEEIGLKLIDSISAKIDEEQDIGKVGECLSKIAGANKEAGLKLSNSIDIKAISDKIYKEKDIWSIGVCVSHITEASKEAGLKLANCINIDALLTKIEIEKDIGNINICVSNIAEASKNVGMELANRLNINTLLSKIEKEDYIGKIGACIWGITKANKEVGMKLTSLIDFNTLLSKIEREKNLHAVGDLLSIIEKANKILGLKLVDSFLVKIEKEDDIHKIGWSISNIKVSCKELALALTNRMNIEVFSAKIEKEEDIAIIASFISSITEANKEIGLKLANSIDIKSLSNKIEKEEDIWWIGECVSCITEASKEAGLKLVDTISSRLTKEENTEKINRCMQKIAEANEEVETEIFLKWKIKYYEKQVK